MQHHRVFHWDIRFCLRRKSRVLAHTFCSLSFFRTSIAPSGIGSPWPTPTMSTSPKSESLPPASGRPTRLPPVGRSQSHRRRTGPSSPASRMTDNRRVSRSRNNRQGSHVIGFLQGLIQPGVERSMGGVLLIEFLLPINAVDTGLAINTIFMLLTMRSTAYWVVGVLVQFASRKDCLPSLYAGASRFRRSSSRSPSNLQRVHVAAVCYRVRGGELEFLLVRTRNGHWTFPKGRVDQDATNADAAAREAYEEAGVRGSVEPFPFICYW